MTIIDKRTARVLFLNNNSVPTTVFMIPVSAISDDAGTIGVDLSNATKINIPTGSSLKDVPAGFRIGVEGTITTSFKKFGATADLPFENLVDKSYSIETALTTLVDAVQQGDVLVVTLAAD